jgi:hypothetical protein
MTFYKNKNRIVKFALNYRTFINGKWREIYRVDNYHGFLHEQKFWISPEPIPIKNKENIPLNEILTEYSIIIKEHYEKYRSYYINAKRSDKNE